MNCRVMGIVNVTHDSFSDGGKFFRPDEAVRRARNLAAEGAEIIDLGGESTRPGSVPIGWEEEWSRIEPVIRGLAPFARGRFALSVDTYHPETAELAVEAGVNIVNCVYAAPVAEMLSICSMKGAELVIPFRIPGSVPAENSDALTEIPKTDVPLYLDPMIGFGTTREDDLSLLGSVPAMSKLGRVLIGASRKRIVKKLTGEKVAGKNVGGSVGVAIWAAVHGASVVRVHDVGETIQALKVYAACDETVPANCHLG